MASPDKWGDPNKNIRWSTAGSSVWQVGTLIKISDRYTAGSNVNEARLQKIISIQWGSIEGPLNLLDTTVLWCSRRLGEVLCSAPMMTRDVSFTDRYTPNRYSFSGVEEMLGGEMDAFLLVFWQGWKCFPFLGLKWVAEMFHFCAEFCVYKFCEYFAKFSEYSY